ncbi:MAG: GGDEF domain-containing protein [Dehalococcoidia bacterium]|nr:GGDEF domain-containing protein [Dehalococcoidia bacterium]MCL4231124.1 GGDEF domain-containing protein [Dehalococcoidia bacterium]NUQ55233.1 GGDEF domain-containing protein [Dehalococcoidia bacterium]
MNKPQALNAFLFPSADQRTLGSVETPAILRWSRPTTLALWLVVFAIEAQTIISTGTSRHWIALVLSSALFVAAHVQFWYEESEQGRRFHRTLEKMRGRIYEDDETGLPNSRHFVFELRRQMMRSVRNGRGFSLVLTDIVGFENIGDNRDRVLMSIGRTLRQAMGDGDFTARLQGSIFAAIVSDERDRTAADKADSALVALGSCIPLEHAGRVYPVVSITGYEGEIEVRDFLRRAQRDLIATRSHDVANRPRPKEQRKSTHAA